MVNTLKNTSRNAGVFLNIRDTIKVLLNTKILHMDNVLNWEINPADKKEQIQKGILIVGPLLIPVAIWALIRGGGFSPTDIIHVIFGLIIFFLLILLVNKILPYPKRSYSLDNNGIIISKGNKTKTYLWSDFECFYPYSERYNATQSNIVQAGRNIEGEIFYLKAKPQNAISRFTKVFVVVYSGVTNSQTVKTFLLNHLPIKQMKGTTDLGFIFYEFQ